MRESKKSCNFFVTFLRKLQIQHFKRFTKLINYFHPLLKFVTSLGKRGHLHYNFLCKIMSYKVTKLHFYFKLQGYKVTKNFGELKK